MRKQILLAALLAAIALVGCQSGDAETSEHVDEPVPSKDQEGPKYLGQIDRLSPKLDEVISPDAQIEILAEGFEWTEGPVWLEGQQSLLFSDIPRNTIFRWSEKNGLEEYLKPSGYTGQDRRAGEPGSNGLLLNDNEQLVLCQHGDRRIALMNTSLDTPAPEFVTLVDNYQGKRFNSPNDAVFSSAGDLFFTDPPYGLEGGIDDPAKELDYQGVYVLRANRELKLLTKELSRPNGIGFSPDERKLYVANSDPERAIWMEFSLDPEGRIYQSKILHDATALVSAEKGLPDGMAIDRQGHIFATGPGGVWVFSPQGEHLGTIRTGEATANCTFNARETELYITADMYLLRVKLK